ncbi:hypothetical protein GF327_07890 [Candidatus Woesearchaeota archaeon]|nr:hypothetical protein [Candidatus Woesearchaeota archaeon]
MEISLSIQLLLTLFICLVSSFIISFFFNKLKLPRVLGPLIVGLVLNIMLSDLFVLIPEFLNIVEIFANLGILLSLFYLGLKIDFETAKPLTKHSFITAINTTFFPFILGMLTTYFFGYGLLTSFLVGVFLTVTAEEVSLTILDDLNLVKKKIGNIIIEAGTIGNIFEVIIIALIGLEIKSLIIVPSGNLLAGILSELFIFVIIISFSRFILVPLFFDALGVKPKSYEIFFVCFIVLNVLSLTSDILNFGNIIGALLAGLIVKDYLIIKKIKINLQRIIEVTETVNYSIFEPMTFIWVGILINPDFLTNPYFGIVLTIIALFGKLIGAVVGNILYKKSIREGLIIGWGLNSRGSTELFAILIAKKAGLIHNSVYNAVVIMAVLTTFISPIVFEKLARDYLG